MASLNQWHSPKGLQIDRLESRGIPGDYYQESIREALKILQRNAANWTPTESKVWAELIQWFEEPLPEVGG